MSSPRWRRTVCFRSPETATRSSPPDKSSANTQHASQCLFRIFSSQNCLAQNCHRSAVACTDSSCYGQLVRSRFARTSGLTVRRKKSPGRKSRGFFDTCSIPVIHSVFQSRVSESKPNPASIRLDFIPSERHATLSRRTLSPRTAIPGTLSQRPALKNLRNAVTSSMDWVIATEYLAEALIPGS